MEYRTLGKSGIKVSAITFGAWAIGGWMWGGAERKDAVEAIRASIDEGVTSIDTAPVYGQGLSEEIVGEAIRGYDRSKLQILTKFGMRWDLKKGDHAFDSQDNSGNPISLYRYAGPESVIKECDDSLRRLGTDYIDLLQIHWPDTTTPISDTMGTLQKLIDQGKIRAAGVSNYNASQVREATQTVSIASDQVPYSMVERTIEKELLPYAIQNDISIIAYSPLQRGLLTGKIKPGHQFAAGDHRPGTKFYKQENLVRINEMLEKLRPIAAGKNATLAQLVIRWTIEQPGITVALVGARDQEQSVANARAIDVKLSREDIQHINTILNRLQLVA